MITDSHGHYLQAHLMYEVLARYGLMSFKGHIKPEGFPPTRLEGDGSRTLGSGIYFCKPSKHDSKAGRGKARLFVRCSCGEELPFGRLDQHVRGQKHKKALAGGGPSEPNPDGASESQPEGEEGPVGNGEREERANDAYATRMGFMD